MLNTDERWLVRHEPPPEFPFAPHTGAVSPAHLYRMTQGWRPPDLRYGVIVRNTYDMALSIANRSKVLNTPSINLFRRHAKDYYRIMDDLLRNKGGILIEFTAMVTYPSYVHRIGEHFGVKPKFEFGSFMSPTNATEHEIEAPPNDIVTLVKNVADPYVNKWRRECPSVRDT